MSRSFIPLPSMRFGGHRPPGGGAAGSGAGSNPSGAAKSSFSGCFGQEQIILTAAPVFFTSDALGSGVADGFSSSRRGSAAAIGFSAVFTHTTIPCPVVTGGGRYLHRYKFGPLWNESGRPLFSSATACPLPASPDCRSFGSTRVTHRHGKPIGLARAARVRPSRPIFRSPSGSSVTVIPLRCRPHRSS